jgi:hypothetical protein
MMRLNFVPVEARWWVEIWSSSPPDLRYLERVGENSVDLRDFIEHLEGCTMVRVLLEHHGSRYCYRDQAVVSVSWISACAWTAYSMITSLRLDASFRPSHHFMCNVAQGIIRSDPIPLALVVNVIEDITTYQRFLEDPKSPTFPPANTDLPKPLVSDKDATVEAFCQDNRLRHPHWDRHIIDLWGANSPLGIMVIHAASEKSSSASMVVLMNAWRCERHSCAFECHSGSDESEVGSF